MSAYVGSAYASGDYMDSYFSVSPAQALASGLNEFDADAGFKHVGVDLGLDYRLTQRVTLKTQAGYGALLGDEPTARSPNRATSSRVASASATPSDAPMISDPPRRVRRGDGLRTARSRPPVPC